MDWFIWFIQKIRSKRTNPSGSSITIKNVVIICRLFGTNIERNYLTQIQCWQFIVASVGYSHFVFVQSILKLSVTLQLNWTCSLPIHVSKISCIFYKTQWQLYRAYISFMLLLFCVCLLSQIKLQIQKQSKLIVTVYSIKTVRLALVKK